MMHWLELAAMREHYKDLLREAERERFIRAYQWNKESRGKGQFANVIATKLGGLVTWRRHVSHHPHTADA